MQKRIVFFFAEALEKVCLFQYSEFMNLMVSTISALIVMAKLRRSRDMEFMDEEQASEINENSKKQKRGKGSGHRDIDF